MRLNPLYPVSYPAVLADALLRQGRLKEARDLLAEIVRRNPIYISAHLLLAGVHGETGDLEKAREAVREVLRINPAYRLSMARRFYLSSDTERQQRFVSVLESAGLPE
jgi:predicted Zn-dependent protease